ncbi:MAG TPA: acyl-CoA dehydrogenase family protein [Streptosporangiaceae bacterium]
MAAPDPGCTARRWPGRAADRAVQVFGGRGYMRENVAERFYRELRVNGSGASAGPRKFLRGSRAGFHSGHAAAGRALDVAGPAATQSSWRAR